MIRSLVWTTGGDTLTYNVYSIEAPEIEQPQGYEARKYLYNMILQRRVEVTPKGGRTPQGVRVIATTRDNDDVARSDAAFGICVVSQRYGQ